MKVLFIIFIIVAFILIIFEIKLDYKDGQLIMWYTPIPLRFEQKYGRRYIIILNLKKK